MVKRNTKNIVSSIRRLVGIPRPAGVAMNERLKRKRKVPSPGYKRPPSTKEKVRKIKKRNFRPNLKRKTTKKIHQVNMHKAVSSYMAGKNPSDRLIFPKPPVQRAKRNFRPTRITKKARKIKKRNFGPNIRRK